MNENKETSSKVKTWNKIIRKIWDDPSQESRLLQNPHEVLKENGIDLPKNVQITIHKNTANNTHFVIPIRPTKNLSDEFLNHIVAGLYYADY